MKALFALLILMIGLVVMPPGRVQASDQPTGACFVLQVDHAPVAVIQLTAINPETFFVYQSIDVAVVATKEGGNVVEKSVNTSLALLYRNKNGIVNTTMFSLRPDYALRTCLTHKGYQNQNLEADKTQSHDPVKIRADSPI